MISLLQSEAQAWRWKPKCFPTRLHDAAMGLRSTEDVVCSEMQMNSGEHLLLSKIAFLSFLLFFPHPLDHLVSVGDATSFNTPKRAQEGFPSPGMEILLIIWGGNPSLAAGYDALEPIPIELLPAQPR